MRAYKFLADDGHSVYSGTRWPLPNGDESGPWVMSESVDPCRSGIHGCRASDLAYWLSDVLYEIELDGEITEVLHKIAARRGRLVRRVDEYPEAVRELGVVSAWRTRDRAVVALRAEGHENLAAEFAACATVGALEALGPSVEAQVDAASRAARAALVAADCAHWAPGGPWQHSPFIAACAAGYDASDFDAGFGGERRFQSEWLTARLALA